MADVECPYCGADQNINHDDGYGYEEDETHQQECDSCGKNFAYTTSVIYLYQATKADCLNGAPHKYKPSITWPKTATRMICKDCGASRRCTDEEMRNLLAP